MGHRKPPAQCLRALHPVTLIFRRHAITGGAAIAQQQAQQTELEAHMRGEEHASAEFAEKVAAEQVRLARVTIGQGAGGARDRHIDVLAPRASG